MKRSAYFLQGIVWVFLYILVAIAPLVILLIGPVPPGRELWRELSVGLGFLGLSTMTLQFILAARFKAVKAPYGADVVYHFHRQISLMSAGMILLHPLLLFINAPRTLALLNLLSAPWRARLGVVAVLLVLVLMLTSFLRKQFRLEYHVWRILHGLLATGAVALAMGHIFLVDHYLNLPWKKAIWIAYGLLWVGLIFYLRVLKSLRLARRPYMVERIIPERGASYTLVVKPQGHQGMGFQPGQFAWLTAWKTPYAHQEHPFSFSSSAAKTQELAFTVKELGDFTRTIKNLKPGQVIYLEGPFGIFSIDRHPQAPGYAFVAGGVGITPVMSMLRTLADRKDRRPLLLMYANRDWESVLFREELDQLKKSLDLTLVHVLEQPPSDWKGERGFITEEMLDRYLPAEKARDTLEIFICGPLPMMNAIEDALDRLHVPSADVHSERFDLV